MLFQVPMWGRFFWALGPWGLSLKEEVEQKIVHVIAYHASAVRKVGCTTNKFFLPEPVRNAHRVAESCPPNGVCGMNRHD